MRLLLVLYLLFQGSIANGQNTFNAKITDAENHEPLIGATVRLKKDLAGISDLNGLVMITNIPDGSYNIKISYVGYEDGILALDFPQDPGILSIELVPGEELDEIIITSTRSSRTIEDIPTRVEAISAEELTEKAVMRSSNIAMVLRESTGIQMQQTSASSANQSIRIQGLDGRHTQILKDGFPLYGGFSGGLSIMQIPPLDLKQVEVIKGSSSTLFGGGAIAGLINLITITPQQHGKLKLMVDQTGANGTTFNGFYGERFNHWGTTLFVSANRQQAYDSNNDDFSDLPRIRSLTINPSWFYYFRAGSDLRLTINATLENRLGGDMQVIEDNSSGIHQFAEENRTERLSYQLTYRNSWEDNRAIRIKNSLTYFDRNINQPDFVFSGKQWSSFSEISYDFGNDKSTWITGLNLYSDHFDESPFDSLSRDYSYLTAGTFLQNTYSLTEKHTIESGFRLDYDPDYGFFALPRVSILTQAADSWSLRLGGGLGYKLPTLFTEEAEDLTFRGILPINSSLLEAERSLGGNFDVNFKTLSGKYWTLSINQLFFFTRLNNALVLRENSLNQFFYENANGPVESAGIETNVKLGYKDFKLFANYALIDTKLKYDNLSQQKPLTPKHNFGAVLIYEVEDTWRIGYEAYFTGRQLRSDLTKTSDYWTMGLMAMRKLDKLTLYINFENFTDTRQHRLEDFRINSHVNPTFPEIWAPTDGRIINAGIIYEL